MTDGRITEAQLAEIKDRHPCDQFAAQWVALRRAGRKMVGPCPICSSDRQSKSSTRFECDGEGWVCAVCADGGDVIKLVQKVQGFDFRAAIEHLGGARQVDSEHAARLAAANAVKLKKREADSAYYREAERRETFRIWGDGLRDFAGTAALAYLERRHLELPPGVSLRALSQLGYFERVGTPSRMDVIARAPAMLAAIVNPEGRFAGLHMTYLDLDRPNGKLAIQHPETGEDLKAKKVRGSMMGNRIELVPAAAPRLLIVGEGIETVLSVWRAFVAAGRSLEGVAFWSAVSLGNLAGKALKSVRHPSLKSDAGRTRLVPGPDPDLESAAIIIPDSVAEVLILGDGDSDPFTTGMAVYRAGVRFARPGRSVRVAWAPPGQDFNNLAPDWPRILELVDAAAPPAQPAIGAAHETDVAPRQRRGRSASPAESTPSEAAAAAPPGDLKKTSPATLPPGEEEKSEIHAIDDRGGQDNDGHIPDAVLLEAAQLDHSDTDNAQRLNLYFGRDLTVMAQTGVQGMGGAYLAWSGTHWDNDGGMSAANIIAQRVGDLIKREADMMAATKREQRAIDAGAKARVDLQALEAAEDNETTSTRRAELRDTMIAGLEAMAALGERKKSRRKHAVTSKNAGKIEAMLRTLSHHLRQPPEAFNSDPMLVATRGHTLRFVRTVDAAGKATVCLEAKRGHDRGDLITALVPVDYDPQASCPKFIANMERFQPDPDQRRTIQQFTGLGLLGLVIQRLMFHYGTGGNFKSVYLELITRVLGDSFAVGLPAESIAGKRAEDRGPGAASPDLERVFGKRMLRVLELPDGVPLQAPTIKKLTGGERWPVRTLYKGYYEFQPHAKTHMSGNSLPHFDGSDGGMRRRLLLVEWPVTIAERDQRDFEEVVTELHAEAPGILNWMIAGALDYLEHGLFVAASIAKLTAEQIEEMDPIGQFFRDCVVPDPTGPGVQARPMYDAYKRWSEANAKRLRSENKFGRDMKKLCARKDGGHVRVYLGVKLEGVPHQLDDNPGRRGDGRRYHDEGPPPDDDAPIV